MSRMATIQSPVCRSIVMRRHTLHPAGGQLFVQACWMVLALASAAPANPATQPVSFAREIAPIFIRQCQSCHGPEKAKQGQIPARHARPTDHCRIEQGDAGGSRQARSE